MASPPRVVAFYLPQFHPVEDNDRWWGKGFTEWTNTAKAKPLFPGHYQPHIPKDLGFYDLRVPESRLAQAEMARAYGIEAFCYYHYWFGNGRRVLERPFQEVLDSGEPDFPFCICWANETWSGIWHGCENRILIKQEYSGEDDERKHFFTLLPAFRDPRYFRVDGRPVFVVYRPFQLPYGFATRFRALAAEAELEGLHLVGVYSPGQKHPRALGFDAGIYNSNAPLGTWGNWTNPASFIVKKALRALGIPTIHNYKIAIQHFFPESLPPGDYPSVIHAWDNTPRSGVRGLVLQGSTPELFRMALRKAFALTREHQYGTDGRLIFLKSWNEWAEGNHLEPDMRFGHAYLEALKSEIEHEQKLLDYGVLA